MYVDPVGETIRDNSVYWMLPGNVNKLTDGHMHERVNTCFYFLGGRVTYLAVVGLPFFDGVDLMRLTRPQTGTTQTTQNRHISNNTLANTISTMKLTAEKTLYKTLRDHIIHWLRSNTKTGSKKIECDNTFRSANQQFRRNRSAIRKPFEICAYIGGDTDIPLSDSFNLFSWNGQWNFIPFLKSIWCVDRTFHKVRRKIWIKEKLF